MKEERVEEARNVTVEDDPKTPSLPEQQNSTLKEKERRKKAHHARSLSLSLSPSTLPLVQLPRAFSLLSPSPVQLPDHGLF